MPAQFVLFESASGYSLFDIVEAEEISALKAEVQASVTELARFSKICKLKAFQVCMPQPDIRWRVDRWCAMPN